MKRYRINWISKRLGESYISAKNKKEAKKNANDILDYDWKKFALNTKWVISKIEIIKEADHEAPA